jgi:hypothetical protein
MQRCRWLCALVLSLVIVPVAAAQGDQRCSMERLRLASKRTSAALSGRSGVTASKTMVRSTTHKASL